VHAKPPDLSRQTYRNYGHQANHIEHYHGEPNHDADADRGGSHVLDSTNLFVFAGFQEITYGFDGAVEKSAIKTSPVASRIISKSTHCWKNSANARMTADSAIL
jgi:hypothetical protein